MLYHPKYGLRPWRRHSLVLMVGGLVYIAYGFIIQTWDLDSKRIQGLQVAFELIPSVQFFGYLWISVGTLACLSSRWPVVSEKWGYAVLTGFSAAWSATYFAGLVVKDNTLAETGGGLVWALIAFLWWAITGLMNPDHVVVVEVEVPHGSG